MSVLDWEHPDTGVKFRDTKEGRELISAWHDFVVAWRSVTREAARRVWGWL